MISPVLRIVTWNIMWATPQSRRGHLLRDELQALEPDVACITEGREAMLPPSGHFLSSDADYGYSAPAYRRKVLLWSREPWSAVDALGSPDLPGGRFIGGTTATPLGKLRIIGVCIPWRDAHVRSGRRDRKPWQDHLAFLRALPEAVNRGNSVPTLLMGDFNQRLPPRGVPARVSEALAAALERWQVATSGSIPPNGERSIDHIAHTRELRAAELFSRSRIAEDGTRLSDHIGIVATFSLKEEILESSAPVIVPK